MAFLFIYVCSIYIYMYHLHSVMKPCKNYSAYMGKKRSWVKTQCPDQKVILWIINDIMSQKKFYIKTILAVIQLFFENSKQ